MFVMSREAKDGARSHGASAVYVYNGLVRPAVESMLTRDNGT